MLEGLQRILSRIAEIEARFMPKPPVAESPPKEEKDFKKILKGELNSLALGKVNEGIKMPVGDLLEEKKAEGSPYWNLIQTEAKQADIDPYLVLAVVKAESNFNKNAVSPKGARGLMQLMPSTARQLGVENSFSAQQNIRGGVRYLKGLMEQFPTIELALAAYNAGPNAVNRFQGVPPYSETKAYVKKVLEYYRTYKTQ